MRRSSLMWVTRPAADSQISSGVRRARIEGSKLRLSCVPSSFCMDGMLQHPRGATQVLCNQLDRMATSLEVINEQARILDGEPRGAALQAHRGQLVAG